MRLRYKNDIFSVNTVTIDVSNCVHFKVVYNNDNFGNTIIFDCIIEGLTHSSAEHMLQQMLTTGYIDLNEWRDITVKVPLRFAK